MEPGAVGPGSKYANDCAYLLLPPHPPNSKTFFATTKDKSVRYFFLFKQACDEKKNLDGDVAFLERNIIIVQSVCDPTF